MTASIKKFKDLNKFVAAGCIPYLSASIKMKMHVNVYLFLNSLMAFWKYRNLKQYLFIFLFESNFNFFLLIFCSFLKPFFTFSICYVGSWNIITEMNELCCSNHVQTLKCVKCVYVSQCVGQEETTVLHQVFQPW